MIDDSILETWVGNIPQNHEQVALRIAMEFRESVKLISQLQNFNLNTSEFDERFGMLFGDKFNEDLNSLRDGQEINWGYPYYEWGDNHESPMKLEFVGGLDKFPSTYNEFAETLFMMLSPPTVVADRGPPTLFQKVVRAKHSQ